MRTCARLSSAGLIAVALLGARSAAAFERQQHAGLSAGGALMTTSGTSKLGVDLGLHYTYGLSDAFNLVAEGSWAGFSSGGATGPQPSTVAMGGVGVVYVLDVLRWVPYVGALVGPAYFTGGAVDHGFVTPDVTIAAGLDYAITREWAVGVAYRQHMFVAKTGDYPEFTGLTLRAEYVWGW